MSNFNKILRRRERYPSKDKLGDAHGNVKTNIKPVESHIELAENLKGSTSFFLIMTLKEL